MLVLMDLKENMLNILNGDIVAEFPRNPTNGDIMATLFPKTDIGVIDFGSEQILTITSRWWKQPFKKKEDI